MPAQFQPFDWDMQQGGSLKAHIEKPYLAWQGDLRHAQAMLQNTIH
jgi:hypothetical protein